MDYTSRFYHIKFQEGPLKSTKENGCQIEDILSEVLIPHLEKLNKDLPCRENALAITKLEEALLWLNRRTQLRMKSKVDGTSLPHNKVTKESLPLAASKVTDYVTDQLLRSYNYSQTTRDLLRCILYGLFSTNLPQVFTRAQLRVYLKKHCHKIVNTVNGDRLSLSDSMNIFVRNRWFAAFKSRDSKNRNVWHYELKINPNL